MFYRLVWMLSLVLAGSAMAQTLQGSALYLSRIALPPTAVFEASLEALDADTDTPRVISRSQLLPAGLPPFRFKLRYEDAEVSESGNYLVRSSVREGTRTLFTAEQRYTGLFIRSGEAVTLTLQPPQPNQAGAGFLAGLPASFEGLLPCADCEAVRWRLELLEDGAFMLRQTWLGKQPEQAQDQLGRWQIDEDRGVLRLLGTDEAGLAFRIHDRRKLLKLDQAGHPIVSLHNYTLERQGLFQPFEARLEVSGMYRYQADSGQITLCASGQSLPVAQEADNARLEAAYAKAVKQAGEPVLVRLTGRIALRSGPDGRGPQLSLVPEQFRTVLRQRSCAERQAQQALRDTRWVLVQLGDKLIPRVMGEREAFLQMAARGERLSASGGCNRLMGSYVLKGDSLRFGQLAGTMMACSKGMEREQAFIQALEQVRGWRLTEHGLELLDEAGQPLARLQAGD